MIAGFLVLAGALTLTGSTVMLTVLNLTYYLLGQLVPGGMALLFFRRVQGWAVSVGIIAGLVASLVLYTTAPTLGGVNAGLVAVLVNLALTFGLSALRPAAGTEPMSRWTPRRGEQTRSRASADTRHRTAPSSMR